MHELEWDLRALDAAANLTDARVQEIHPSLSVAGFLPSLHLNVADASFRAGDAATARRHLDICLALEASLSDSPFDALTRKGIENLSRRLAATGSYAAGRNPRTHRARRRRSERLQLLPVGP